uniref:Small ribosomal subunit protein uS3c n=3 Tax=Joinvillea TaxID=4737 RepID=A0A1D8DCD4_9POAL|nr:ribosomal protein S3 [Joinvillea ascendens]YP_010293693.1 ribosomal protein S3 [Joinvillea sp. Yi14364]ACT67303.1 ribosomal protein S3 [Joinvillea plicata]AOS86773.1 ribosomal protein S3 [Joinvillea ascendens]ULQ66497.1 ribosomal protein S3 [Joinvillea sp. Yi14364]
MGQKINPLGFRLGTTQNHHSFWFAQPKNYSEGLQEDKKIRNCIKNYIQKNKKIASNRKIASDSSSEVIAHIEIQKQIDVIHVIIHVGFPNLLKQKRVIKELQMNVQKEINSVNQRLNIAIAKVQEPYRQPNILAEYIASQLKKRVSFRKAMKKAIDLTKKTDTKGVQVQIAGRLGGKEIARAEWIRKGRLPLQTIRAKIDHCCYPIRTIYGVLGLKIWIFVEEE